MMIDARLATEIVARTVEVMPFDVNVMDAHGVILASSDAARVGEIHAGAQLALARARAVEIDDAMAANLSGARPGINLPLSVRGKVCGVIGVTGEPDAVRGFGELLRVTAELILEREQLTVELRRNARHREEFVLQLLRRTAAAAELEAWAGRLGIDVRLAHAAIVCRLSGVDADPEAGVGQIEAMQSQLANEWPQLLSAKTSYRELVMFEAIDARAVRDGALATHAGKRLAALEGTLRKVATQPFALALGIALDGIDGFERSYQCALATLRVGAARTPQQAAYSYYDFVLPVLLSALSQGWQARQLRLPLTRLLARERRSGALLDTLKAWYANDGHPGATAQALGIHRNTLDYRLQQIRDATGLDLGAIDDRLWLYIALQTMAGSLDGDADDRHPAS
ncbi:bacterial regulatory, Fis family protein [Burkholderia thailandensis 34]|uniref:sugar diacid recognition domain-containing protein n=1 Tax=Burkholderia thailandensis TaxID=57975 RepID=UPI0005DA1B9E|nr:sugar diacid recognition domain-containing protein [Burkholderia thailandensis]AJY32243.1 bacterial regulatory, Fis family protein [Burkholderia thailandensis 34]AOJ58819.1 transcriptional regulator [Burkholderia thailandensis]KXF57939.1 transcriptional regulator [Burkholderia thailandensis]PNE77310.1 transcriptional regulator [Burkholderia thailandensis]